MKYLLDTNIFLWWLENDRRLNKQILRLIQQPDNHLWVSIVSAWEVAIKTRSGKLPLKTSLKNTFAEPGIEMLPISLAHVLELDTLPLIHKDPFDRMLIAQARVEKLTLVSTDTKFKKYKVRLFSD